MRLLSSSGRRPLRHIRRIVAERSFVNVLLRRVAAILEIGNGWTRVIRAEPRTGDVECAILLS
jgi:ribosomal protein L17